MKLTIPEIKLTVEKQVQFILMRNYQTRAMALNSNTPWQRRAELTLITEDVPL